MYNYQSRGSMNSIQSPQDPRASMRQQDPISAQVSNSRNPISKQTDQFQNYQSKMKALGRVRYKNQLAQLEY